MATVARINKEGNLKTIDELNERIPLVTDGLTHHFPMDGRAGTFDCVGGVQPSTNQTKGVNLIETQDADWRDPSNWVGLSAATWDDGYQALKVTGYRAAWLENPIIIDTTKTYQISIEVMEVEDSDIGLYLGGVGYNKYGEKVTANYDYTMASNYEPTHDVWITYKLTRTGESLAASGTSLTFDNVKGWSGGASGLTDDDDVCYKYHLGGLFNYSSGGILYVRNPSIVVVDDDVSGTTISPRGITLDESTTNLITSPHNTFDVGNGWGTYNTNNYNNNVDYSIGTVGSVTNNIVTLSSVDRVINTYDVLNAGSTGGGVTAGTNYIIKKHSATTFSLHTYVSTQDGSLGKDFSVHDSVNFDQRVSINATSFPTMWHGTAHLPNSGLVKEIIPNIFELDDTIYPCLRLHTEHRNHGGSNDYMAYGYSPAATVDVVYSFSFWFRAANKESIGNSISLNLYSGGSHWTGEGVVHYATEEWQQYKLDGLTCPATGTTSFYFPQTQGSTIDVACIQMEQKPFATAFVNGTRSLQGDLTYKNVLSPSQGTVVLDITFHEDNTVNNWQGVDQYCFNNGLAWNVTNSFHFHDTDAWYIYDNAGTKHSLYMNSDMVRNERTHLALVYSDTTGEMSLYKNGTLDITATKSFTGKLGDLGTDWSHSGHLGTSHKMCQTIHGLSFYDKTLTADEVKKLAKNTMQVLSDGEVVTKKIVEMPLIPDDAWYNSLTTDAQGDNLLTPVYKTNVDFSSDGAFVGTAATNQFVYPTFNTSSSGGGWNHWGDTGYVATFGQDSSGKYNIHPNSTYCHWVDCDSSSPKSYLLYQSPACGETDRCLSMIITRSDFGIIDESVVYPVWQSQSGGVSQNIWSSIEHIGGGSYLCKVDGIHQDGTNDLVGVYVRAGYKLYFTQGQLENRYYNTPFTESTRTKGTLEFNLYRQTGLSYTDPFTIIYWKKPVGTHDDTLTGYNIDSLGQSGLAGYEWWGKANGADTIDGSSITPANYFNNWHMISLSSPASDTTMTQRYWGIESEDSILTIQVGMGSAEDYYVVTTSDHDLQLGGWAHTGDATNTYFRDLIVIPNRELSLSEIKYIYKGKMRQINTGTLQIKGTIHENEVL